MGNLLDETLYIMKSHNKEVKDILFIGSESGYSCSWEQFAKLADVEYDEGFGKQEVASDLKIIFRDGSYLERGEYDGWEYKCTPKIPAKTKPIKKIIGEYWPDLNELNSTEEV